MSDEPESALDRLWVEYSLVFKNFDDHMLARWMAQTLGQFEGAAWRMSHPLLGAYRLAAQLAHDRQIWLKRLATTPSAYPESSCCRAPLLPLLTRDILETGLVCQHCTGTVIALDELPETLQNEIKEWADQYAPVHAVAHWEDRQRKNVNDYERTCENAARKAEKMLAQAGKELAPKFLEIYPAIVWEDQDECLEVRPEDIEL